MKNLTLYNFQKRWIFVNVYCWEVYFLLKISNSVDSISNCLNNSNVLTALAQLQSGIHLRNKCIKFHQNPIVFGLPKLPWSFSVILGLGPSPGPKNQNFQKVRNVLPGFHPRNKCAKFQPNRTIFEVSRLPQSFSLVLRKNSSPGPKNQNFWKMKKTPPDIHPRNKCTKFQPNWTIFKVSRLPQSFRTDIHTYRHTYIDIVRF